MSLNPIFDTLEHDILGGVHAIAGWFDRNHQTPAATATATAPTTEEPMSVTLTGIASDIKNAIENADQWVKEVTENHLPAILAQAQKYESSLVVQALEAAFLTPEEEQQIAGFINLLAKAHPVQPAAPAEPVPAVQG